VSEPGAPASSTAGTSPSGRPQRRLALLRRTVPLLMLLAGAIWYFRDAPMDVTLAMDLAGRRDQLETLTMDLYRLPERHLARHVERFYSASSPPPPQLRSVVRVQPGEYRAELVFGYAGGRTERLERSFTLERGQQEAVLPP